MKKYNFQLLFALMMVSFCAFGQKNSNFEEQSPYQINYKIDIPFALGAYGFFKWGEHRLKNKDVPEFTVGQWSEQDIDAINAIDRSIAQRWDLNAKDVGKSILRTAEIGVPLAVLALPGNIQDRASTFLVFCQGYHFTGGLVTWTKSLTNRYRPYSYMSLSQVENLPPDFKAEFYEDIEGSDVTNSFFSGDAAKTAYSYIFFAKAFNDYFPNSKYKKYVWATSIATIGVQGYFRVKSGKHFPSDVIVGSIVGGIVGYLVPHFHKRTDDNGSRIDVGYVQNGLGLNYTF